MVYYTNKDKSLSDVHSSIDTTVSKSKWRKLFSFLGPAYLVSVGYMDPGNWATDLAGGSKYGYSLIWVLLMSNLMALILQSFSARLGIVYGKDLAQASRETYPKSINFTLYLLAEISIAACDLAEVLGMAIGIKLLTGLSLLWGVSITILDTFLLLYLQKAGMRKMEAFILTLVAIIFIAFLIQIFIAKPIVNEVVRGFIPNLPDKDALYIAIAIIGATVMPHNLYLHSALVQSRKIERTEKGIKNAIKLNNIDTGIALNLAFFVNAGILILAGTLFYKTGNENISGVEEAYKLLPGFLGNAAPILFAVALIAAGQSSTITGTLAGQIIMEGYLSLRINPALRRLITRLIAIVPTIFIILIYGEGKVDALLIFSQVILSLQLGFAVIPLIHFVSDKNKMGQFAIKNYLKVIASIIVLILVSLNIYMLWGQTFEIFSSSHFIIKTTIIFFALIFLCLLIYITIFPILKKVRIKKVIEIHDASITLPILTLPKFKKIAIALDFSENDHKLISNAVGQGGLDGDYILIHVVESVSAKLYGSNSDDYETKNDILHLESYVNQLLKKGFRSVSKIGFKNRVKEIVRIVIEEKADMLVIGSHGHKGLKDFLYGETVDAVRHNLKIPLLIITV